MTTDEYRDAPVQVWLRGNLVAAFTRAVVLDTDPETGAVELELTRGWTVDPSFVTWANRVVVTDDGGLDERGLVDLVVDVADQPGALYARHELRGCWASSFEAVEDEDGTTLITSMTVETASAGD